MQYFISVFLIAFAHQRALSFEPGTLFEADNLTTLRLFRRSINVICTAHMRNLHKDIDKKIAHMGVINCKKYQNKMLEKNILKNTSQGILLNI